MPPEENTNRKPCKECPFARHVQPAVAGLGDPCRYVGQAVGPFWLPCHEAPGYEENKFAPDNVERIPQCAGAAIYRANVGVLHKFSAAFLHAEKNTELVFASHAELLAHHLQIPLKEAELLLRDTPAEVMCLTELRRAGADKVRLVPKDRRPK